MAARFLAPLILAASLGGAASANDVALTWSHPDTSTVDSYTMRAKYPDGTVSMVTSVAVESSPQTVVMGPVDLPAQFTIAAVNATGESPESNSLFVDISVPGNYDLLTSGNAVLLTQAAEDGVIQAVLGGEDRCRTQPCPIVARWHISGTGVKHFWGYLYYKGGGNEANSFYLCIDGDCTQFGNRKDAWGEWHWDGNGHKETGQNSLKLELNGHHILELRARETYPTPPSIQAIYIADTPDVPTFDPTGYVTATTTQVPTTAKPPTTTTTLIILPPCSEFDLNNNGSVDLADALVIMRVVVGQNKCVE
jgi:hypothetical protein